MTETTDRTEIIYGWSRSYIEALTRAVMRQIGVTKATTCSKDAETKATELWSATDVGLVWLHVTGDWDGVEAKVTPWTEVRGVQLTATATDSRPDPTATLTIANPSLELEVGPLSSFGGPRSQQWPFVREVLRRSGTRAGGW